jgi:enediyne biosynthesis protein E4
MAVVIPLTIRKWLIGIIFGVLLAIPFYLKYSISQAEQESQKVKTEKAINEFGFYFTEVSKESGVDFKHQSPVLDPQFEPIMPQIASMGASVSVCDFNRDGWSDFYVTNSRYHSKNALYQNQKDGSFLDVAPELGLADVNTEGTGTSMGSIWADIDNDGFEDLLIYKWGKPLLFRNEQGETFTNITENSGLPLWINSNSALWLDYNADGYIDLFLGGYFPEDVDLWNIKHTAVLTESFEYAQNGGRNFLFENKGKGRFEDVSQAVGLTSTRWTLAAASADINEDGYPELIVANDYGIDEYYQNINGERFMEEGAGNNIGFAPKSGMNVSLGDINNSGHFGIYISNITEDGVLLQGNNLWIPVDDNGQVTYKNLAVPSGIENGGWSYGAQFGDLNNDGFQDLYVANGFISAKKGRDYWYDYSKVTGGNATIISDIKNWPNMQGRSQSGYQKNKVWVNREGQYFEDAAPYVSNNESFDSRAVVFVDLWNRGVLDVIVANQNNQLLIYKNSVREAYHWIEVELKGTRSNASAIGSIVKVYWNGQVQRQVLSGGMGFSSQNQRRLHFGLGEASKVDKIEILWPSGIKQDVVDPTIGKVHEITELQ